MKKRTLTLFNILTPLLTILILFVIWLFASLKVNETIILPTPAETFEAFFALFKDEKFLFSLLSTFLRSLLSFSISFILAVLFAVLSYKSRILGKISDTIVPLIRALPTVAVVLLLVLWTTATNASMIVTLLVIFPTLYTNARAGLQFIDKDIVEMCSIYKIKKSTRLFKVYIPAVLPSLTESAGAGLSLNVKLMVAAEVLAQVPIGLGMMMNLSKIYYETPTLFALVFVSVIIGLIFEIAGRIGSKAMRYKYDKN